MPLFLPLLGVFHKEFPQSIAADPFFFGIMGALNQQTSFLSPPVAMSAYYLKGVVGKAITLNEIFTGMYPFLAIQIVAMGVLWLFPQIAYFFPDLVYGVGSR
jgi:TRAP-type mannitol/chloroaromatic compound transport system permease large subunit